MEKRSRNNNIPLGKARHFLNCVILEQRAATEELRASNLELERLLEEILSKRHDLREVAAKETGESDPAPVSRPEPPDVRVTELKREAAMVLEQGTAAVRESARLRRRSQQIRAALEKPAPAKGPRVGNALSRREHQVLTLIVAGKSSKEIAAELGISFKTAVTHRASIMSKLDVHEIASVVREAIRRGLV
jgi:DNA-binding CsgD family transcriptional regulator